MQNILEELNQIKIFGNLFDRALCKPCESKPRAIIQKRMCKLVHSTFTGLFLWFLSVSSFGAVIDFGTPSGYSVLNYYMEDGYSISTHRMEVGYDFVRPPPTQLQGGLANVQAGVIGLGGDIPFIFNKLDGGLFALISLDLRTPYYLSDGSSTGNVLIDGVKSDGSHVYQSIFYTQGWTTFTLPSTFTDLSQVVVAQGYFALDSIVTIEAVPEPQGAAVIAVFFCMLLLGTYKHRPCTI